MKLSTLFYHELHSIPGFKIAAGCQRQPALWSHLPAWFFTEAIGIYIYWLAKSTPLEHVKVKIHIRESNAAMKHKCTIQAWLFLKVLLACSGLRDGGEQRQSGREKTNRDLIELRRAGGARLPCLFLHAFRISSFPAWSPPQSLMSCLVSNSN